MVSTLVTPVAARHRRNLCRVDDLGQRQSTPKPWDRRLPAGQGQSPQASARQRQSPSLCPPKTISIASIITDSIAPSRQAAGGPRTGDLAIGDGMIAPSRQAAGGPRTCTNCPLGSSASSRVQLGDPREWRGVSLPWDRQSPHWLRVKSRWGSRAATESGVPRGKKTPPGRAAQATVYQSLGGDFKRWTQRMVPPWFMV